MVIRGPILSFLLTFDIARGKLGRSLQSTVSAVVLGFMFNISICRGIKQWCSVVFIEEKGRKACR